MAATRRGLQFKKKNTCQKPRPTLLESLLLGGGAAMIPNGNDSHQPHSPNKRMHQYTPRSKEHNNQGGYHKSKPGRGTLPNLEALQSQVVIQGVVTIRG
jgi:hypothetical protein